MGRRGSREAARRAQARRADRWLGNVLAKLSSIPNSVWFDPAWEPGVVRQLDGATWRITSMQSRPINTQYTVSQGTLSIAPAEAFGPNGKRTLSFAGTQHLGGAAALAGLLQGSATYSEVQVVIRTTTGNAARWCASQNAGAPDNRVLHYVSATALTNRWRVAGGGTTSHTGSAVTNSVAQVHSTTYSGTDYDGWLAGVSETLTAGGANTRAPATLDMLDIGAQRALGVVQTFWTGTLAGLIITPGHVLSAGDRAALETSLAAYYGY